MAKAPRCILIGGTSHVGKSTLSHTLGEALGYEVTSTDTLARHPGRPWPQVRPHVGEFYEKLSDKSIHSFLLNHHQNMWPQLKRRIAAALQDTPLILEGSALRPEYMAEVASPEVACVCLWAPDGFIKKRTRANSGYVKLPSQHRALVDAFIERSLRDNAAVNQAARQHAVELVDVSQEGALGQLVRKLSGGQIGKEAE